MEQVLLDSKFKNPESVRVHVGLCWAPRGSREGPLRTVEGYSLFCYSGSEWLRGFPCENVLLTQLLSDRHFHGGETGMDIQ